MKHSFKSEEPPSNYMLKLFRELKKIAAECNAAPSKRLPNKAKIGPQIPTFNRAPQNVRFRTKNRAISLQETPRPRQSKEYTVEKTGDAEQPDQAFYPRFVQFSQFLFCILGNLATTKSRQPGLRILDVQPMKLQTILEANRRINNEQLSEINTCST
eukprot:snap_masked-scaffold_4-processed-gene-6.17-mRNA-1 protein AED:1.00 eAED:1.00 QI:0/-1/0/0/-1/1/1/0/156